MGGGPFISEPRPTSESILIIRWALKSILQSSVGANPHFCFLNCDCFEAIIRFEIENRPGPDHVDLYHTFNKLIWINYKFPVVLEEFDLPTSRKKIRFNISLNLKIKFIIWINYTNAKSLLIIIIMLNSIGNYFLVLPTSLIFLSFKSLKQFCRTINLFW